MLKKSTNQIVECALQNGKLTRYDTDLETSVSQRIKVKDDGSVIKTHKKVEFFYPIVGDDNKTYKIEFWRTDMFGNTDERNFVSKRDVRFFYNKKRGAVIFEPLGQTMIFIDASTKKKRKFKILEHERGRSKTSGVIVGWFV